MPAFSHLWPWIGLGLAAVLLFGLFSRDPWTGRRGDGTVPRMRDPVWLAWAAVAAYLLHQFEEHGIDAQGTRYAFRGFLCAALGFADAALCPIPEAFITAVNIPVVWLAGPAAALLGRRWPALALAYFGVPAVNAMVHIAPAVVTASYNPGLATALLLFLPLSLWAFRTALSRAELGLGAVIATIAGGVLMHAVLMLSLRAYLAGWIDEAVLLATQLLNPGILLLVAAVARRKPVGSLASSRSFWREKDG